MAGMSNVHPQGMGGEGGAVLGMGTQNVHTARYTRHS